MSDRVRAYDDIEELEDEFDELSDDNLFSDGEREYEEGAFIGDEPKRLRRGKEISVFDASEIDRRLESEDSDYRETKRRQEESAKAHLKRRQKSAVAAEKKYGWN